MVPAVEVDHGAHDVVRTVTYSKNVEPQEPTTPPDDNPTGPKDSPENPETPQKLEEPQKQNPEVPNKDSKHLIEHKSRKVENNDKKEKVRTVAKKHLTSSNRPAKAETYNRSNGPKSELLMKRIKSNNVPKSMVNNSHSTAIDNKAKTNGETLPQTGEKSSKIGIILGLLTISLASLFGLGKKDRKED